MRGTEEKGVDVRMATDMISLAWVDYYDIAVLVSSDRDFVPVAEFLETRGGQSDPRRLPSGGFAVDGLVLGKHQRPTSAGDVSSHPVRMERHVTTEQIPGGPLPMQTDPARIDAVRALG